MNRIRESARRRNPASLSRAAFLIRAIAKAQFRRTKKRPSPEGMPPHTRKGRLPRAILYAVDKAKQEAVIGPSRVLVGEVGGAHEHGKKYKGDKFKRRSFMGPALGKATPLIGPQWSGTIGA
jgi:hypothetical protein